MRFIYFSDWHGRVTPPENRLDDYKETMRKKLSEVLDIGEKYNVDGYLEGGDFLDAPNTPLDYVSSIIKLWKSKTNKPLIGIVGNHEEYANNIKSIPKTVAGFIGDITDFITFVSKDNPYIFTDKENNYTVAISGVDYHLDMDTPEHISDYIIDKKQGDVQIHLTHGMLNDKSLGSLIKHTTIDQIKDTKADVTLSGHDHIGFPMMQIDGKFFCNPGGLARISNNLKEIKRKPKILLISVDENKKVSIKPIYLKTALKGEEVLDRTVIESKKAKDEKIAEFKSAVMIAKEKKSTDILEIVKTIGKEKDIDSNIINEIIDEITDKVIQMKSSLNKGSSSDNIYIEKIILENFQSHKDSIINCSKNFNIFIGESGQGKSAILRALSFVYENKGKVKRIITRGKTHVRVTLVLNNGYKVSRYAEKKNGGKNGYEVYNPNTNETEFFNTKALPDIQNLLGYSPLNLDKDLSISLNFMKQGTGWFLISDDYTAPQRAKIIGGIYGTQFSDGVVRNIEVLEKQNKKEEDKLKKDVEKLDSQIEEFDYLDSYNEKINKIKISSNKIVELEDKIKNIKALISEKDNLNKKLTDIDTTINKTKSINSDVKDIINKLKDSIEKTNRIESISKKIENLDKSIINEKVILSQEKNVNKALSEMTKLKQLNKNKEKGIDILSKIKEQNNSNKKINKYLQNIDKTLKITENVDSLNLKKDFDMISNIKERRDSAIKIFNKRNKININIKKEETNIENLNKDLNVQVLQYKNLLKKIGRCPICLSPIDDNTIDRIISKILSKN